MAKDKNGSSGSSIISISLPRRIVDDMEIAADEMGYMSRSELVRDAIRSFLKEKSHLDHIEGPLEGVVTLLYNHEHGARVSEVRHQYMDLFRSFLHSDFNVDQCSCCEVLVFSGDADKVRAAFYDLRSIKGVEEANIYIASRCATPQFPMH